MMKDTELRLAFWRDGSTQAERLSAAALRLLGYEDIDPQSPIGGPDGAKDIICRKGGITWVGAAYFPSAPVSFGKIRKKFLHDLTGAPDKHKGFVFVTNQTLSPRQRSILRGTVFAMTREPDIVHLQQLQNLLDSPLGYGVRLQYLGITMNLEEQLSWTAEQDSQTARAVTANTRELLALKASIQQLGTGQETIVRTLGLTVPSNLPTPDLISVSSFAKADSYQPISRDIAPNTILLFHRLACFDLPVRAVGCLRTDDIWLGGLDGTPATHIQPPPPSEVSRLLTLLCDEWRMLYPRYVDASHQDRLKHIAEFHSRLLVIHPFIDGNGRAARAILMQQCLDFFGKANMALMNKGAMYYGALRSADAGEYRPLADIIEPIVSG